MLVILRWLCFYDAVRLVVVRLVAVAIVVAAETVIIFITLQFFL